MTNSNDRITVSSTRQFNFNGIDYPDVVTARWAVFFTLIGEKFRWEPMTFGGQLSGRRVWCFQFDHSIIVVVNKTGLSWQEIAKFYQNRCQANGRPRILIAGGPVNFENEIYCGQIDNRDHYADGQEWVEYRKYKQITTCRYCNRLELEVLDEHGTDMCGWGKALGKCDRPIADHGENDPSPCTFEKEFETARLFPIDFPPI
jgi:hypothetical protein